MWRLKYCQNRCQISVDYTNTFTLLTMVRASGNLKIRPEPPLFSTVWTIAPLSSNTRLDFQNMPLSVSMIVCVNMRRKKKITFTHLMVWCLTPILTAWGGPSRRVMFAWPRIGCTFEMIFLGYWSLSSLTFVTCSTGADEGSGAFAVHTAHRIWCRCVYCSCLTIVIKTIKSRRSDL